MMAAIESGTMRNGKMFLPSANLSAILPDERQDIATLQLLRRQGNFRKNQETGDNLLPPCHPGTCTGSPEGKRYVSPELNRDFMAMTTSETEKKKEE
jgi:hypothetical protein